MKKIIMLFVMGIMLVGCTSNPSRNDLVFGTVVSTALYNASGFGTGNYYPGGIGVGASQSFTDTKTNSVSNSHGSSTTSFMNDGSVIKKSQSVTKTKSKSRSSKMSVGVGSWF